MSNSQNLHRMAGAQFTRIKHNLCPNCLHRTVGIKRDCFGQPWEGHCAAKGTFLSASDINRGRCPVFEEKDRDQSA